MKPKFNYILGLSVVFLLLGCDKLNSNETAGDKLDNATDRVDGALKETGVVLSDTLVTEKVKAAIMAEPNLKSLQINIETNQGKVKVYGIVDSKEQVARVNEIVLSLAGVKKIQNDLSIKTPSAK